MWIRMLLLVFGAAAKECCWQAVSMDSKSAVSWKQLGICFLSNAPMQPKVKVVSQGGSYKSTAFSTYHDPSQPMALNYTYTLLYNRYINKSFEIYSTGLINGTLHTNCRLFDSGQQLFPPSGNYCFGSSARPGNDWDLPVTNSTVRYAGYNFTRFSNSDTFMDVSSACEALVINASDGPITIAEYTEGLQLPPDFFTPPPSCFRQAAPISMDNLHGYARILSRPFFALIK